MKDFRKLTVWQKAHQLTLAVYKATRGFPKEELYGLTSQVRRSSVSVPSNIAEGCGRRGDADLARFLDISMGSASEVEYQLLLAHDLGFLHNRAYEPLAEAVVEVKRMLGSFIGTLRVDG